MNTRLVFLAATLASSLALAQQPPTRPSGTSGGPPQGPPPRIDFAKELNLAPERARQLEAILVNEQEQHRAARERARAEIAKLLTAEEFVKFESLLPRPRGPMGPPPERR
jgi:Spy/CpxP family protein refolding chaperone